MVSQTAEKTCKYRVRAALGGWRVDRADACLGTFANPVEAIDQACRSARADAERGCVAVVTTETTPQEFHCYAPPQGQPAAEAPNATPYLRLLVNR
jgi:hypothetical protein